MKSPWTKKNPWLSMYLSAANTVAGSVRGHAASAIKRQISTARTAGLKQLTDAWTEVLLPSSPKRRKGRRR